MKDSLSRSVRLSQIMAYTNQVFSNLVLTIKPANKKGKVRFHVPGRPTVDVCVGEALTVPVRLPHKFSNPFDEEAVFINTATPGFFIRYFELLENMIGEGKVLTPEINAEALKRFATIPVPMEDVERLESQGWPSVKGNSKRM